MSAGVFSSPLVNLWQLVSNIRRILFWIRLGECQALLNLLECRLFPKYWLLSEYFKDMVAMLQIHSLFQVESSLYSSPAVISPLPSF